MKILHIVSSPRTVSYSKQLGKAVIEKLSAENPGSTVKTHDLTAHPFPHLEEVHLNSFFTPKENHTPELAKAIKHSDEAIAELQEADTIVIDVPMYNFGIPSSLKAWVDHIARAGVTFRYTENGPEGLLKNKKVYLTVATGGVYTNPDYKPYDFTESYMKAVLGFLGMTDVKTFRVEGVAVADLKESALDKAVASIAF